MRDGNPNGGSEMFTAILILVALAYIGIKYGDKV